MTAMIKHFRDTDGLSLEQLFCYKLPTTSMSPFNLALLFGARRACKLLMNEGAVEIQKRGNADRNWFNDGPLMICAASDTPSMDVTELLIQHLAKLEKRSTYDILNNTRRVFCEYEPKAMALFFACNLAWMLVPAKSLSGFAANFCQSCGGKTPLMMAAHSGFLAGVLYMLDHGADVTACDGGFVFLC